MRKISLSKIICILFISILAFSLLASACAQPAPAPAPAPAPEMPTVTWQWATEMHSYDDGQMIPFVQLSEAVAARTDGKFQINMALAEELGIKRDGFAQAVSTGVIEGCQMASGYAENTWPHQGVLNLPYLASSAEEAAKMQAAVFPISDREYAKNGIKRVGNYIYVAQEMFVKEKVEDFSDLHGLKIRGWTQLMLDWVEAAGGVPISMPSVEVYAAMQRGVVDGGITGSASAISGSWYEVAPFAHQIHFIFVVSDAVVNQAAFDALPKEYQDILIEEGQNFVKNFEVSLAKEEATAWDIWKEKGGEVVELTPAQFDDLKAMVLPLWDKWLDEADPTSLEAFEAVKKALGI